MIAETIKLDDGYTVEIHYDEDAANPFKEFDMSPTLVLHDKAEGHFGWTNDEDWGSKLSDALERLSYRHPKDACLGIIQRWLRVAHGVRVVLPVGAGEHSGTWTYLGSDEHWSDPGGWDSGWVGWLFATRKQITEWGFDDRPDDELRKSLVAGFSEFEAYVSGQTYGYVVKDPDGDDVPDGSCWGFYGDETFDERVSVDIPVEHLKDGDYIAIREDKTHDYVGKVVVHDESVSLYFESGVAELPKGTPVSTRRPGHMREAFMEAIESDRAERAVDDSEVDDLRLAEIGA